MINDIECREPIIIEKIEIKKEELHSDIILCNRVKGVLEGLAVAAIFTTLGLLIWTVC